MLSHVSRDYEDLADQINHVKAIIADRHSILVLLFGRIKLRNWCEKKSTCMNRQLPKQRKFNLKMFPRFLRKNVFDNSMMRVPFSPSKLRK